VNVELLRAARTRSARAGKRDCALKRALSRRNVGGIAGQVEVYDTCASQAARYSRAFAELTVALSRHRGKLARIVMEHHHHHLHQRIA
jgi:hypothetical protein